MIVLSLFLLLCGWPTIHSLNSLKYIYPNIQAGHFQDRFFLEQTILSGRNDDVDEINQQVLDMFPGQETVYWSTDKDNRGRVG